MTKLLKKVIININVIKIQKVKIFKRAKIIGKGKIIKKLKISKKKQKIKKKVLNWKQLKKGSTSNNKTVIKM